MASELKKIPQITCSLFPLYLIYNFEYSFSQAEGTRVKIYFVNQLGIYDTPKLTTQTYTIISVAGTPFTLNLYPIKYGIELKSGRRIMWVDFVDDTFKLDKYYVALTGTISGFNIFQLGTSVDTRTSSQQINNAIDPIAQQIKTFTQFLDVEYSFQDFYNILKNVITVGSLPNIDTTITKNYIGKFREVLNYWCKFYNLIWYFENSKLNFADPTKIFFNITPSSTPIEAIEYEYSQSLEDTYGKTVAFWYRQQGNEIPVNGAGGLLITNSTLFPLGQNLDVINDVQQDLQNNIDSVLGDIANVVNPQNSNNNNAQSILDPLQVVAALYGKNFWFLYNYFQGTASTECGWTPVALTSLPQGATIVTTLTNLGLQPALLNEDLFEQKYQAYLQYGQGIAGRYYMSSQVTNIDDYRTYQWYNITPGEIFDFTSQQADSQKITMQFALSQDGSVQTLPDTLINQYYDGIKYIGNVMYYKDSSFSATSNFNSQFTIDPVTSSQINEYFGQLMQGLEGNDSLDYSELTQNGQLQKYIGYMDIPGYPNPPTAIQSIISQLQTATQFLQPTFSTFNAVGVKKEDVNNLKVTNKLPQIVNIIDKGIQAGNAPPSSTFSNGSVLRVPRDGQYIIYYDKISNCLSAYTDGDYFQHRFETKNISEDVPTPQAVQINNPNNPNPTYVLNRDLTYVNQTFNTTALNSLTTPRAFNTIEVKYKFNYLHPIMFIQTPVSNGLVGINISVSNDGIEASCSFSNKIFQTPDFDSLVEKLELQLKNSWTRNYQPTNVLIN